MAEFVSNNSGGGSITISEERVDRVLGVVALAAAGAFDEAMGQVGGMDQDRFGFVEQAIRIFLAELRVSREQEERARTELQVAKAELEVRLETIERQKSAIRELSTPIIEVWNGILTLPLIGLFDSARAAEVTEKLLVRVVETRASWVLIDLTGVDAMDSGTSAHLLKLAKAVQLVGCRCILTGIGPNIAATLVALGVDLEGLTPLRSLGEGLKYCLNGRAQGGGVLERAR